MVLTSNLPLRFRLSCLLFTYLISVRWCWRFRRCFRWLCATNSFGRASTLCGCWFCLCDLLFGRLIHGNQCEFLLGVIKFMVSCCFLEASFLFCIIYTWFFDPVFTFLKVELKVICHVNHWNERDKRISCCKNISKRSLSSCEALN